jgi:hypothetical protein
MPDENRARQNRGVDNRFARRQYTQNSDTGTGEGRRFHVRLAAQYTSTPGNRSDLFPRSFVPYVCTAVERQQHPPSLTRSKLHGYSDGPVGRAMLLQNIRAMSFRLTSLLSGRTLDSCTKGSQGYRFQCVHFLNRRIAETVTSAPTKDAGISLLSFQQEEFYIPTSTDAIGVFPEAAFGLAS